METKTGKIKTVGTQQGSSPKGAWTRWIFEMEDGKKYSTFNSDIGTKFKTGDQVAMTGEQNGKFWNMKTMDYAENVETETKEAAVTGSNDVVDLLRQILAELKNANK